MKKLTTFFGGCIVLASLIVNAAWASNKIDDAQIYQLLDKSGVTRAIEGMPMQMNAMGQQMGLTSKDPAGHQEFMKVFTSSINTNEMILQMLESVRKNATQEEMTKILQWLDTELASRVVAAELQSTAPEFQQNLMHYMADLQTNPPSAERTAAIIHYVESSNIVDHSFEMIMGMLENMFSGLKATSPEDSELASNLDLQLQQMMTAMKPAFEQQMILTSYYIYRDISNEDLAEYSDFYQKDTGKKYLSLLVGAVGEAMGNWGSTLVNQINEDKSTEK